MSVEYDFETIDLYSLATISKSNFIQAILKLVPKADRGLIIVMSGVGNAHPNVTDNPRFANYIWIDIKDTTAPVIKVYAPITVGSDQYSDWVNMALADNSITASKIAQYAVTVLTPAGANKIALQPAGLADLTKANWLLRIDAAGQYIEIASAATVVNAVGINLSQLKNDGAANGYVVTFDGATGVAKWSAVSVNTAIADNSLQYAKLVNGAAANYGWLLRANPTNGIIELVSNSDKAATNGLLAQRSVRLNRLDNTSAAANDKLRFDGNDWVRYAPFYGAPTSGGIVIPNPNGGGQLLAAHGLGAIPKIIRCYLECAVNDAGYLAASSHRVDAQSLILLTQAGEQMPGLTLYADATNIVANFGDGNGAASRYRLFSNTAAYIRTDLTPGSWNVKFYAEL